MHACLQFIFISPEEMRAVAGFIRQRGRISIAELAQRSAAFIDLAPRGEAPVGGLEAGELELPGAGVAAA